MSYGQLTTTCSSLGNVHYEVVAENNNSSKNRSRSGKDLKPRKEFLQGNNCFLQEKGIQPQVIGKDCTLYEDKPSDLQLRLRQKGECSETAVL